MKLNEVFKSNYWRAADVKSKPINLTIVKVELEQFRGDAKPKLVLSFAEDSRRLVVNKTNRLTLVDRFGEETDGWLNNKITLTTGRVLFDGEMVDSLLMQGIADNVPF